MKKVILSTLLAATLFAANDYKYEVTPVVGYLWNKGSDGYVSTAGVDNHAVFGAQMQFNNLTSLIKPELSVLYGRTSPVGGNGTTGITTGMLSGVVELPTLAQMTPYAKAGIGYEMQSNGANGDDGLLLDAGLGAKYALTKNVALKAEWLYFLKDNKDLSGRVQNSTLLAGLSYAFGENAKPAPVVVAPAPKPIVVAPKPAPVVVAPKPVVVAPKPAPVVVAPVIIAPVVVAPVDSDKDGVFDPADKCANTPAGYKVDADGCPVAATLHLNFVTGSNKIDAEGTAKIAEFADFMKASPIYNATITGHTDSVGAKAANQKLSVKRAEQVKAMLVKQGIVAKRLTAKGKGATAPVATNATKEGRAENRRIEVELSK